MFKFRKKKGKATGVGGEWHMDNFSSKPNFSPIWRETKPPKIWAQGEDRSPITTFPSLSSPTAPPLPPKTKKTKKNNKKSPHFSLPGICPKRTLCDRGLLRT